MMPARSTKSPRLAAPSFAGLQQRLKVSWIKPMPLIGKAASDEGKVETFWMDGPGSALNTLSHLRVALQDDLLGTSLSRGNEV